MDPAALRSLGALGGTLAALAIILAIAWVRSR